MSEEEKRILSELLDKLECPCETGRCKTCPIDCHYYISGTYGGECAISIVQGALN